MGTPPGVESREVLDDGDSRWFDVGHPWLGAGNSRPASGDGKYCLGIPPSSVRAGGCRWYLEEGESLVSTHARLEGRYH